ncbi:MAG: hypothetical protein FJ347_09905 [Sphingomonadales bacterium]|nr:hypothetical protein [Sphingomonadales bacterium]
MRKLFFILLLLVSATLHAQPVQGPAPAPGGGSFLLLRVGGGFYPTGADLAKGFPQFASLPTGLYYKSAKNITLGVNYTPFWGNKVSYSNLFGDVLGPSGEILDQNGFPTIIRYYMRGNSTTFTAGKLLGGRPGKPGQFEIALGAGFMQHYVKMQFDAGRTPQLEGAYAKGYDRLTNGLQLVQHFRWHYLNPETISLFAGIDVSQGFTKNRRSWNYADGGPDNSRHFDFYSGISAGIIIPLSLKAQAQDNPKYFD